MDKNQIAFKEYVLHEKKYSVHTVSAYEKDLLDFAEFIADHFDQDNLSEINYSQIRSWIVFLMDNGLNPVSVNRKIASLKAFYKFLLKSKQIEVSPLVKFKSLKTGKKIQIPFSEKEVQSVLMQGSFGYDFEGIRNKLVIDLFYASGIRRAELIELKISYIDFHAHTLKVVGKRNKERILPILPEISKQIKLYLEERADLEVIQDSEFLFLTKSGNKLNISLVYRLVNGYFSGVSEKVKRSPHILRHSFATHLLNNGADINSVKDLLGHATLASTQVYTHNSLAELKKTHAAAHPRRKNNV
ncbi:tyrosine-type recombinase/integrase [Flavobacterium tegetincola]|uniref:tyrosine-type recombinase/integrase n=1 Tax=Flavobacterium tegetincola TaxID=150172 RepID=UPI000423D423|nr:tyrosine-type recombinase/integrase [Flavobacterium tegetincola]